jgi:hypothetical protein
MWLRNNFLQHFDLQQKLPTILTKFRNNYNNNKPQTITTKISYVYKQCKLVKQQLIIYIFNYNKNNHLFL